MQVEVDKLSVDLLTTEIVDHVLFAEHNHPCAVCRNNHSVIQMNTGIMQPCWDCQSKGYKLYKKRKFKWKR